MALSMVVAWHPILSEYPRLRRTQRTFVIVGSLDVMAVGAF